MNEKINADLKSLRIIFDRNKLYILPVIIIITCAILFWQFVIPQFRALFIAQEEIRQAKQRLQALKENLSILTNTDEKSLDAQLKILNLALPPDKDFSAVLNSIYLTSQKTGVSLGSFSLQIGELLDTKKNSDSSVISLSIPINAGVTAVNSFVEIIGKTFPLSEVALIKIGNITSTIRLSFYYKPLGPYSYEADTRIISLNQKELNIIGTLRDFENVAP